jgi:hypothetical protein
MPSADLKTSPSAASPAATASAVAELRRAARILRDVIVADQNEPALVCSVAEGLDRVTDQLDRLAGLQELFEWYSSMPSPP